MQNVFVTGAYRSGTTLVEKLLHQHPSVTILSQPFPHLYFGVKGMFMGALGREDPYPLGHLFLEDNYRVEDFTEFLRTFEVGAEVLEDAFQRVQGYSGHWTPELAEVVGELPGGTLVEVQSAMHEMLASRVATKGSLGRQGTQVVGSKEIMCEEFGPYLLGCGTHLMLVVRDPRAVIASLVSGLGERYGGEARPVLFHIRNWRKSVAFALALQEAGGMVLRYEDVLDDAPAAFLPVFARLGLDSDDVVLDARAIVDQRGELWRGNSSFATVPSEPAVQQNRFLDALDESTIAFIESCAHPEMLALGYPLCTDGAMAMAGLRRFREPFPIRRAEFPPDYSTRLEAQDQERQRVLLLHRGGASSDESRRWFIFARAARALSAAVKSGETQLRGLSGASDEVHRAK